MKNN
jgi:hypothetical protein